MSENATTTRKCTECGEWYDARSVSCYLCNMEEREVNAALKKSVETSRLNGALADQMGFVRHEQAAERSLSTARSDPSGESFARVRPRVPGYGDLVEGIKNSLEEHPEVLDYMHGDRKD